MSPTHEPEPEDRAKAIEEFAQQLAALRQRAGEPSYRELARRSGAISHASLHDAAVGNRLASWETTVEFVRACDGSPEDFRAAWQRADAIVHPPADDGNVQVPPPQPFSAETATDAPAIPPDAAAPSAPTPSERTPGAAAGVRGLAAAPPPEAPTPDTPPPAEQAARTRVWRWSPGHVAGVVGAACALLVVGILIGRWLVGPADTVAGAPGQAVGAASVPSSALATPAQLTSPQSPGATPAASDARTPSCPPHVVTPKTRPPTYPGDGAEFVRDVTLDDCSSIPAGVATTKTWQLRNTGSLPWTGRSLTRLESPQSFGPCETPTFAPVGDVQPGASVDVSVRVLPTGPGYCLVRWVMVDAEGTPTFPSQRPYYLAVYAS